MDDACLSCGWYWDCSMGCGPIDCDYYPDDDIDNGEWW